MSYAEKNIIVNLKFYSESKKAEKKFIDIYIDKLNTKFSDFRLKIQHEFEFVRTGGGMTADLCNKIEEAKNSKGVFVVYDIDDKNDKHYEKAIKYAKENDFILVSNRQFEYWLELYKNNGHTYTDRKEKEHYDKIKNELINIIIRLNNDKFYKMTKAFCKEEKNRQDDNFDYDRKKSFSTFYKLMDYLQNNHIDIAVKNKRDEYSEVFKT